MGAPKKIYTDENGNNPLPKRHTDSDIEYIRTDVVVNKAVEYIVTHIPDMHVLGASCKIDELIIEDFRNYMKGE